jgi:hypothetical protein
MKKWEVAFGVLFLLACDCCTSMARRLRKSCFL